MSTISIVQEPLQEVSRVVAFLQQNDTLLFFLLVASTITFVFTLLAVPWLVVRIPADYFARPRRRSQRRGGRMLWSRMLLLLAKNLLGAVFVLLGVVMLVLPGQGLLTILAGLILLDFPGKFHFECALIRRPSILRTINWLRRRGGHEPLKFEGDHC